MIIIGFVLAAIGWIICVAALDEDVKKNVGFVGLFLITVGLMIVAFSVQKKTFKDSLDGKNPYEKVYQYEKTDSGYVKTDSVYINIHKKQ